MNNITRTALLSLAAVGLLVPGPALGSDWFAQPVDGEYCRISRGFLTNNDSLGSFMLTYDKAGYHVTLRNTHWTKAASARQVRIWYGGMFGEGDHLIDARGGIETIPFVKFDLTPSAYARMRVHRDSMMKIEGAEVVTGMELPSGPMLTKFEECRDKLDAGKLEKPQNFNIDL